MLLLLSVPCSIRGSRDGEPAVLVDLRRRGPSTGDEGHRSLLPPLEPRADSSLSVADRQVSVKAMRRSVCCIAIIVAMLRVQENK